jgi:hypothetical protein
VETATIGRACRWKTHRKRDGRGKRGKQSRHRIGKKKGESKETSTAKMENSKQLWQGSGNSHHRKGVQMENSTMEGRKCR